MKALIQRVRSASVSVNGETVGSINKGILLFLGIEQFDDANAVKKLVQKVIQYRIFNDVDGKMNLGLKDVAGELLIVSQFTLAANTKKGLRPSFSTSAEPKLAKQLYEQFIHEAQAEDIKVQSGIFAADMQVALINDGPVTFLLES